MPHVVLEYSENIPERPDADVFLKDCTNYLSKTALSNYRPLKAALSGIESTLWQTETNPTHLST
jgi:5-carboxymethyl-2-hydroxymuconate isomerase